MEGTALATRFEVRAFKSLQHLEIDCLPMMVLFGPNAVGKSNLLEAMILMSRLAQDRTIAEAFDRIQRGRPAEAFSLPEGGIAELMGRDGAELSLEVDLRWPNEIHEEVSALRYRVSVRVMPATGEFDLIDEQLLVLNLDGTPSSKHKPRIEVVDGKVVVRRRGEGRRERREPLAHSTAASNLQIGGDGYPELKALRAALARWRFFYLDPAISMREERAPREVFDVGTRGEDLVPLLYRLKSREPGGFKAVLRTIRTIIPSISSLDVELDRKRGTLDLWVVQDGIRFSSRVISEGTLRLLALCAIAASPDPPGLIAFEEPENGVHPQRIEVVAAILTNLTRRGRQVIVTTHSAIFAAAMAKLGREEPAQVGLYTVNRSAASTVAVPYRSPGPLFDDPTLDDPTLDDALRLPEEEEIARSMLCGWLDA